MAFKTIRKSLVGLSLFIAGVWMVYAISSCGKNTVASPLGLNIQYEVLNLSPDLLPVNLFIDFKPGKYFWDPVYLWCKPWVLFCAVNRFTLPDKDSPGFRRDFNLSN
jgi:hypothetical protein